MTTLQVGAETWCLDCGFRQRMCRCRQRPPEPDIPYAVQALARTYQPKPLPRRVHRQPYSAFSYREEVKPAND